MKNIYYAIGALLFTSVMCMGCIDANPPETYAIYSLDFGGEVSGSFVLGTGSIDTDLYYYFYLQDQDGAYHLRKTLVDNSRIFMDDSITRDNAYVIIYDCMCDHDCPTICTTTIYDGGEFHVPKGTITKKFNADVRSSRDDSDDDFASTYIATQYMNPSSPASPMYYR